MQRLPPDPVVAEDPIARPAVRHPQRRLQAQLLEGAALLGAVARHRLELGAVVEGEHPHRGPVAAVVAGAVDRAALRDWIGADPTALSRLESIVHPAVAADRAAFVAAAAAYIVVLDIPLMFETGAEAGMDATLLVTAPPALQRARVLARGTMTEAQFTAILARQMPDHEKRARATHIIETLGHDAARASVHALLAYIRTLPHA